MSYQQVADGQVSPEVPINENMAALGQAFLWSHDVTADSGLVVGFSGGVFNASPVADTTLTATDNATNYVVAHRSTLALSVATSTTNWTNTATYGRVARLIFASGVLTFHDERHSAGGIFDHASGSATGPFDVHAFYPGVPTALAKLVRVPVARAVSFAANFSGSYGSASAAATASTVFDIQKNGVSIGAATFAAAATTATFTSTGGTGQSLAAGDVLSIVAPASPDATLADVGFALAGTR
jgi:hypothetical protein